MRICDTVDFQWIHLSSGQKMRAEGTENPNISTYPIHKIALSASDAMNWNIDNMSFTSGRDGLFSAVDASGNELWKLEEGIAHPDSVLFFADGEASVLVILSELQTLFALDALSDGNVLWKISTRGTCRLLQGHISVALLLCNEGGNATVRGIHAQSGSEVIRATILDFVVKHASVENCCEGKPCVRVVDDLGNEKFVSPCHHEDRRDGDQQWLIYSPEGSDIRAMKNGKLVWKVDMPTNSKIATVTKPAAWHPASSRIKVPAVRIKGDRHLLFKYVDNDLLLVLAENEEAREIHSLLVDGSTGAILDAVTHPEASGPVSATAGESWFVYSFWSSVMLQQEVHVMDLFKQLRKESWVKPALVREAEKILGFRLVDFVRTALRLGLDQCPTTRNSDLTCSTSPVALLGVPDGKPYVVRSSSLVTRRVLSMEITQTQKGFTEPAVIMALESGQVALVSKFLLDARRPREINAFYKAEYMPIFSPILSLLSTSRESMYLDDGNHFAGLKAVKAAPHAHQESTCQVVVVGTDMHFSYVHPAGEFDALPPDFFYPAVVAAILFLGGIYAYTQRLKEKSILSRSW